MSIIVVNNNSILGNENTYNQSNGTPLEPLPFIGVWVTTTLNEIVTLPYFSRGFYTGTINWGDGFISGNSYENRSHTYSNPGRYTITITGVMSGFSYNTTTQTGAIPYPSSNIREIKQWGQLNFNDNNSFQISSDVYGTTSYRLNLSGVTDILNLDNITNLYGCFYYLGYGLYTGTTSFNIPNINFWDTSNIQNMGSMFHNSRFSGPLTGWNTSNVVDMNRMFRGDNNVFNFFNGDISTWSVSNVKDMTGMFFQSAFNQPLSNWERSIPGDTSTLSNLVNASSMFQQCTGFNQNIGNWNTSNLVNASSMFQQCTLFNNGESSLINTWDTKKVNNTTLMFSQTAFNQPLNGWDVSSVTTMTNMFSSTPFNQDIGNWNVSGVTNFTNFMSSKTNLNYDATKLDSIYNNWSLLPLKSGLTITFGTIKSTANGLNGKRRLLTGYSWSITDGGI
jgi:hypothetical protein